MKNQIIKATNIPHSDWWNILSSQMRLKNLAGWKVPSSLSRGLCCKYSSSVGVFSNKSSLFISIREKGKTTSLFIILVIIYHRRLENCLYFNITTSTQKLLREGFLPLPSAYPISHFSVSNFVPYLHTAKERMLGKCRVKISEVSSNNLDSSCNDGVDSKSKSEVSHLNCSYYQPITFWLAYISQTTLIT